MKKAKKKKSKFFKSIVNGITILFFTVVILCGLKLYSVAFADNLNFVQISDVHFSTDKTNTSYKLLAESAELLDDAVNQVNEIPDLDFVMFTGDMINKPYEKELLAFLPHVEKLRAPWYVVLGNHDPCVGGKLTKKLYFSIIREHNKKFKFEKSYYAFTPKKGYRVIGLDSIIDTKITSNGELDEKQLEWLDKELSEHKKDIILIFMHVPPVQPLPSDNHRLLNADEFKAILEKYNNPIAVFAGHYHTTKVVQKDNILYVCTPALVSYPNAFRIIRIDNRKDKVTFNLAIRETRYKDVQKRAKMMAFGAQIYYGDSRDRNAAYTVEKSKNKDRKNGK